MSASIKRLSVATNILKMRIRHDKHGIWDKRHVPLIERKK